MNINNISPFIRVAMHSNMIAPFAINERIIFDYELILVEDGCFLFTIDSEKIVCNKNDIILIRPNHPHKFNSIGNISLSQPHIHFDLVYEDNSEETYIPFKTYDKLSNYEKTLIRDDLLEELGIDIPSVFTLKNASYFRSTLFEIIEIFNNKKKNFQFLYKAKLLELLSYIIGELIPDNSAVVHNNRIELLSVKRYIDCNYSQNINLNNLSKQFNISKFYLTREFKRHFGQPIIKYYNNVRLQEAKKLLENSNMSISQISEALGFGSVYSFSRFFKIHTNSSPLSYNNIE